MNWSDVEKEFDEEFEQVSVRKGYYSAIGTPARKHILAFCKWAYKQGAKDALLKQHLKEMI